MNQNDTHEVRTLRRLLKDAHRQLGKQGETIYHLRNEVAALHGANTWSQGDRARMLQQLRAEETENSRLREKLNESGAS